MPQTITRGIRAMLSEARAAVTEVDAKQAIGLAGDDGHVLVDLREGREIERDGKIPGAFSCPRGMLEFWIDPESPYHKPVFAQDKAYVFYCASGWRSALAAQRAAEMGLHPVAHIGGGFAAWVAAGGPVEGKPR